jgi:Na+-driven multidrug efflux pump
MGNGLAGFVLSIVRQVIIFLPVVIIFKILFGLNGIFLSVPIADIVAGLITAIWLRFTFNQLNQEMLGCAASA